MRNDDVVDRQGPGDKIQMALNLGATLFVTERGTREADRTGVLVATETELWRRFMEERILNQLNWAIAR